MMKKLLFSAILFSPFCLNADAVCTPHVHSDMVYFKHIEGKGYGYNEGYSTLGAFITPYSTFSQVLPFLDLRGHVFNRHWKFAANAGAGIKWLSDSPLVVGAAAYYDYRQTHKHHYNQVGLSFELLCHRWELRANGYLPVGEKTHSKQLSETTSYAFEKFSGHSLFYTTTYDIHRKVEFAMKGADAELGIHLMNPSEYYTLYLGAGPYYFHSPEHLHRHAFGGQVRLQAHLTPYLTLQVSDSWDNLFHNKFQGEISVNIPFGGKILKKHAAFNACCEEVLSMQARMVQPMHRNEIIVADKTKQHVVKTIDPIAQSIYGGPLNFIFVNANSPSGGDGTFENPYNDLYVASLNSSPNNVIYASGDLVLTNADAAEMPLAQNQSLLGSGMVQTVPIQATPTQIAYISIPAMTAVAPSVLQEFDDHSTLFITGDNTVISGITFNLQNPGGAGGIVNFIPNDDGDFTPIQNITIINNTFNAVDSASAIGISLTAISGTTLIQNNVFNGNSFGESGIVIDQEGAFGNGGSYVATVNILNNTISGFTTYGIAVGANSSTPGASVVNALIANNTVLGSGEYDILLDAGSNGTVNATVLNNMVDGMDMSGDRGFALVGANEGTVNATVCGNTLTGYAGHAALLINFLDNSTGNLFICDNTITDSLAGIASASNSGTQTAVNFTGLFTGNIIRSCAEAGVYWEPQTGPVTSKLTFENNVLIDNGTFMGYSFTIQNQSSSTTTIFMNGNVNNNYGYGLFNFNTDDYSFNIEQGGVNDGIITLAEQTGIGPYNVVERHTAAP